MYAPGFDYYRAASVEDAQRLLAEHPGAKLLAGGHSLLPLLKLRLAAPPALVDIGQVSELRGITAAGDALRIGALTTHAEIAASEAVQGACRVLADAAARIGDPAVRNRGTIGGSLAHGDPGADLPTVLTALEASVEVAAANGETRTQPIGDFFTGMMATALQDGEVLTAAIVPALGSGQGAAYAKFAHPASRYAVIGVAAVVTVVGGTCTAVRVAIGGLVPRPARLRSVEAALTGQQASAGAIAAAAGRAAGDLGDDVIGDVFASAEYRREVAPVWVTRALQGAIARAG